ncbi:glycosyltransferase family 4 protein [Halomonas elongata]|uniref:Glycosyltransferase family 1 protein n=1 Tax=Halomonas elongata (strain ATCC 33173 / DSM 2581 / NBRC 15536 / NCIMB 2198 / 1H9) TaxID=768066 RepID=E1V4Q1_HALED|nr:glycosyltransferase family 1 protein [Halomonas elongata]WBF16731.1 glycosyltransferase family 1 protein [Halomonas elongata]WPU45562.1 glycosyltransferase family 1 protein [Halomonas elongata DSM 2581]CBV42989.1 probable glycosyltransferase, type 1 [Halomonas elongata DSM 2581]
MHIVDVTMFHAPASGGVRTYLSAKHRCLSGHDGIRTSLLVPGAERDALGDLHTLPALRLPLGQGYRFPLRRRPWRAALEAMSPDLIEAGDPYVTAWAALEAGQRLGVPVVGFYHSDLPRLMGDRFGGAVRRRLQGYVADLYGRFDSVMAPCRAMAERLASWGVDNVRVQPLGVDLDTFHPDCADPSLRATLGLSEQTRLLAFAGRNSREKNVDVLLDVMQRLGSPYHLLLMGPGMPTRVPDNVTVVPRCCDSREVARALASADAMIHAGTRETFGLVALEAMACGLPVVAARAGALIENVPLGGGILCEPLEPMDMARAVEELFINDVKASGRHARRYVERRFRWENVIDGLLDHYATLTPRARDAGLSRHG